MRRGLGKDEAPDKVMGPLFPRLHVNDTVKGGPRAPPRNKMALYEQFTVPPSRFSSSARAAGGSFVPSTSAGQVSRSLCFALLSGSSFLLRGMQSCLPVVCRCVELMANRACCV